MELKIPTERTPQSRPKFVSFGINLMLNLQRGGMYVTWKFPKIVITNKYLFHKNKKVVNMNIDMIRNIFKNNIYKN